MFGSATYTAGITYDTVRITCKIGYELVNKNLSSRACEPNGQWTGNRTEFCQPVPCSNSLNLPAKSTFASGSKPENPRFGTKVAVLCEKGFLKVGGNGLLECNSDGKWSWSSGKSISCTNECSNLTDLPAGAIFSSGLQPADLRFGMKIAAKCKKGFVKVRGGEEIQCTQEGNWSWPLGEIICKAVTCTDPRAGHNSRMSGGKQRDVFAAFSKIWFSCKPGFEMIGEQSSTCRLNGTWSSPIPFCKCTILLLYLWRPCLNRGPPF